MVYVEDALTPLYLSLIHHPLMTIEVFLLTQLNVGLNYLCYLSCQEKFIFFLSTGNRISYLLFNYFVYMYF